jgi:hypothetical protein
MLPQENALKQLLYLLSLKEVEFTPTTLQDQLENLMDPELAEMALPHAEKAGWVLRGPNSVLKLSPAGELKLQEWSKTARRLVPRERILNKRMLIRRLLRDKARRKFMPWQMISHGGKMSKKRRMVLRNCAAKVPANLSKVEARRQEARRRCARATRLAQKAVYQAAQAEDRAQEAAEELKAWKAVWVAQDAASRAWLKVHALLARVPRSVETTAAWDFALDLETRAEVALEEATRYQIPESSERL